MGLRGRFEEKVGPTSRSSGRERSGKVSFRYRHIQEVEDELRPELSEGLDCTTELRRPSGSSERERKVSEISVGYMERIVVSLLHLPVTGQTHLVEGGDE